MSVSDAPVDYDRPTACWAEAEAVAGGDPVQVATLIMAAPRCAFPCRHCDLGQHALPGRAPPGAVLRQVDFALRQLPPCAWIKLYNGGNFSDPRSIPIEDRTALAARVADFQRVVIENHPCLPIEPVLEWRGRLSAALEVAMGLETANPRVLASLNKRMTVDDYRRTAASYRLAGIDIRTFIVAGLPGIPPNERLTDAVTSTLTALAAGSRHVSIIPWRPRRANETGGVHAAHSLTLSELERIIEALADAVVHRDGDASPIVTVDLWDHQRLLRGCACEPRRIERLRRWNLTQQRLPAISCESCRA